ncbi:hypothetical protein ACSBR2_035735 [Camellia fascicularis]
MFFSIVCSLCFLYSKNTISFSRFFRTRSLKGKVNPTQCEAVAMVCAQVIYCLEGAWIGIPYETSFAGGSSWHFWIDIPSCFHLSSQRQQPSDGSNTLRFSCKPPKSPIFVNLQEIVLTSALANKEDNHELHL